MNANEFKEKFKDFSNREKITIKCECENCLSPEIEHMLDKESALRNINKNGMFKCRSCSYTEEGRAKMSKAASYKRSDESREKMSISANKKWASPEGKELKKKLSRLSAEFQKVNGPCIKNRLTGYFPTNKNETGYVYFDSSYELRAAYLLDQDQTVIYFSTQNKFENLNQCGRRMDFLVRNKDNTTSIIEIKPTNRLNEDSVKEQIKDNKNYADSQGYNFFLWSEFELGFKSDYDLIKWAIIKFDELNGTDLVELRKERNNTKVKKHYHEKIKNTRAIFFCDYCKCEHDIIQNVYDNNVKRNGRYICHNESAHKSGNGKGGKIKENPYAEEGKKQCTKCMNILEYKDFGSDPSRKDGYSNRCKKCRSKAAMERYNTNKKQK